MMVNMLVDSKMNLIFKKNMFIVVCLIGCIIG